ncbi:MAG: DUF386 domain-containing protein [Cellulosilyticum sp.]|nr:DUF386 domain-containing protein [Cellulosilyticum sp.]
MIFGNLEFANRYDFLNEKLQRCFSYIQENDLRTFENGVYHIDGDDIFVNVVEYTTTTIENRFWETHKTYIDIHVMLTGTEEIALNFLQNMTEKQPYSEKEDMLLLEGSKNSSVCLKENDFLICFPEDAHCTGIQVSEPQKLKKAIFKIKVD